jgi:hypothetical protein
VPVERTFAGTRAGMRSATALTFGGPTREQPIWKILLPGPDGTEDLYATQRFLRPDAEQLRAWLAPVVGPGMPPCSPRP